MAASKKVLYPTRIDVGNSPEIEGVVSIFSDDSGVKCIMSLSPEDALKYAKMLTEEAQKLIGMPPRAERRVSDSVTVMRDRPARLDG